MQNPKNVRLYEALAVNDATFAEISAGEQIVEGDLASGKGIVDDADFRPRR